MSAIGLGLSECSDVIAEGDRRNFMRTLARTASELLGDAREYPHSDITRTVAQATNPYGGGLRAVYIFSDLIEHSPHLPHPHIGRVAHLIDVARRIERRDHVVHATRAGDVVHAG